MKRSLVLLLSLFILAAPLLTGCERTPEDVEKWRNAKNGEQKMLEWIKSPNEPMPVRKKALQVLIEEGEVNQVGMALEEIEPAPRKELVAAAVPTVEQMWATGDFPDITDEDREQGGVKLKGPYKQVMAKDAAYFLVPHAEGEAKTKLQNILGEWVSEDWQVRNDRGKTTVGQIAPRAGDKGIGGLIAWVEQTHRPGFVAELIKKSENEEAIQKVGEILRERAEAEHPNVPDALLSAIVTYDHETVVPYLKKAVKDSESSNRLIDASMEAILRIEGPKSTRFFTDLVKNRSGMLRWVAAQRLLESRGKDGFINAAYALPIEMDSYPTGEEGEGDQFKSDTQIFCNAFKSELADNEVPQEEAIPLIKRGLENDRWPAQVLSLQCARTFQAKSLSDSVEALTSGKQEIPAWGEDITVGELAKRVKESLSES
ncbi:MAG: hypothetical protein ACQEVA_00845 [Myxococcota bacterium]